MSSSLILQCVRLFSATVTALLCGVAYAVSPDRCAFDADHYRYTPELYESLDALARKFPALAEVVDYGDSYLKTKGTGGYDLKALHLGNRALTGPKPAALFLGAQHGNELPTPDVLMRYATWLLSAYGYDPMATYLLDEHDIWIVPAVNPDKLLIDRLNARGVDLNRNHSFQWTFNGNLHGKYPASEPEVSALEALATQILGNWRTGDPLQPMQATTQGVLVSVHGFLNANSHSWGYTTSPPPDAASLSALVARLSKINGYRSGQGATAHYLTTGNVSDFGYGTLGVTSVLIEIDGASRPPYAAIDNNLWAVNKEVFKLLTGLSRAPLQLIHGPEITTASINVSESSVTLNASMTGVRAVDHAEYYIGVPPWREGAVPMVATATDGVFDSINETVTAALDVSALEPRRHLVFVRGRDVAGNYGPFQTIWLDLEANTAPGIVVASPGAEPIAQAFGSIQLSVEAVDAEGDAIMYSWLVGDKLMVPCGTNTFVYTPSDSDVGTRRIAVQISDGKRQIEHVWQIAVQAITAPQPWVVDDATIGQTTQSGTWTSLTSSGALSGKARYTDGVSSAFNWTPTLAQSGYHAIYARWPFLKTGGAAVPYFITHDGGTSVVYVNQRDTALAGRWNLLGVFPLTASINGGVRITGAGGRAIADGVQWIPSGITPVPLESVVDNTDTAVTRTGTWTSSLAGTPWGTTSMLSGGPATFRWLPAFSTLAHYDVYAWWTYQSTRSTSAPYRILHADGEEVVTVNQRNPSLAGRWNKLGTFRFGPGVGHVELSSANGPVSADAVRLLPAPPP